MAKRNRETLKNYFRQGARPTEQEFADLVDSSLNILDDGFSKDPQMGIELSPLLGKETLVSLFRETIASSPQWEISIDKNNGDLHISRIDENEKTLLLGLRTDGSLSLGEKGREILFSGALRMPAREGTLLRGEVPADGRWHDLTEISAEGRPETKVWRGCRALEVVASVGVEGSGRHAILVATATTCFGESSKVKKVSSYYGSFGNRILLRWQKIKQERHTCKLQLKTILKYGDDAVIRYHVTSLWNG